ncbi:cAMP-binding domain of CRP or a regulatory subunit of cAMP-dependent protein kinases [Paenimyroides ummariense]|uniref:cAMP-binding domain of CRP or a regulatory subunit of cAMP-dependent protein kinases n=1 Tax=Paenimyroides ummariense TaxID=913024 RepID=A0A1I5G8X3_9FLAO|nr:Crp/Fnr family transcriptional regulator [Paenimyroides ummariense]SFO32454.1 cAMP-binding domain of CRP or a regulatory subunit of cAMP-dependent protein kinases [Paenimyroides ummariense]
MEEAKIILFLKQRVKVTDEEALQFASFFREKTLRKKQLIVQPGFVAQHRFYVTEGALRSFITNPLGNETTIALAAADWWITDYNSYIYQQPATLFVEAVTKSTVLQLSFEDEAILKNMNPKFEMFFRIIAERGLAAQQRRLITNLTQSAEERYVSFAAAYPQFVNLIPQYIIASFLGMSTEFLSKIRNKKVSRKP